MAQENKTVQREPKPAVGSGIERLIRDFPEASRNRISRTERMMVRDLPTSVDTEVRSSRITW
jgi:hypothetical protein